VETPACKYFSFYVLLEFLGEVEFLNKIYEPSLISNFNSGKETVKHLAEHHGKVYLAARSEQKATAAIEEIRENVPSADIRFLKLDMMDFASVVACAKGFLKCFPSYHN
jgi:hypothetical protein